MRPARPPPCAHPTTRRRPRPSIPSCRTGRRLAVGRTTSDLRLLIGVRRAHVRRWCAQPSYCPAPIRAARPRPPVVSAHAHTRLNAHRLVTATDRLLAPPARRTCCRREVRGAGFRLRPAPQALLLVRVPRRSCCPTREPVEPPPLPEPPSRRIAVAPPSEPPPCRRRAAAEPPSESPPCRSRAAAEPRASAEACVFVGTGTVF